MVLPADVRFRALTAFNAPELQGMASSRHHVGEGVARWFTGETQRDRFVRALCARGAVPIKELLESYEVWARSRRRVRRPVMADLCCGHGLTGVVFALEERTVERVVLVDQRRPASFDRILEAAAEVAPWLPAKIEYRTARIPGGARDLPPGTAILAVHACGVRTDRSMLVGIATGGPMALLPCCYAQTAVRAPPAVADALGAELATDVDRTYRMEAAGRKVHWSAIPRAITPMNRLLVVEGAELGTG